MSTRAVYTVYDKWGEHHVYIHCDGYPLGAAEKIAAAAEFAWPPPRFEADDFSAAIVRANKKRCGGDVRLAQHWTRHGDLAYRYEISAGISGEPRVRAFRRQWSSEPRGCPEYALIFDGSLADFQDYKEPEEDE